MSTQIIGTWPTANLEEMLAAVTEAIATARSLGHHPSTVYPNMARLVLIEEILTDGSPVLNIELQEPASLLANRLCDALG